MKNAEAKRKIKEKLDKVTENAYSIAEKEDGPRTFNELIEEKPEEFIDPLFNGSSPELDPYSWDYITSVQRLKKRVIKESDRKVQSFEQLANKVEDIWEAVLHESFAFAFQNTEQISAFARVEKEYNNIIL